MELAKPYVLYAHQLWTKPYVFYAHPFSTFQSSTSTMTIYLKYFFTHIYTN